MAYDEILAERVRRLLKGRRGVTEKAMFGGICFLLNGKMFCGVLKDDLVARVHPDESGALLKKPGTRPTDFTGRPMQGFLYVGPDGYKTDKNLYGWIERTVAYAATLPAKKKR
ncbi:MAG: TfoX/Sxy family protein [Patescibacteria group bacterium]